MATRLDLQAGATNTAAAPTVAASSIPLHRIEGEGELVLLIAGFSCDLSIWDFAAPLLAQKGYRVLRFNNLGVGSGVQFPAAEVNIAHMAEHTVSLLRTLGFPKVHVVGHSMGGQIAQELALAEPARVQSLTLLSSWAKPSARLSAIITDLAASSLKLSPTEWQRTFLPWLLTDAAYAAPGLIDQVVRMYDENPDRVSPSVLQAQAAAIGQSDTTTRLSEIAVPTLVAVGEEDVLTPPSLSRDLQQRIAGSAFELLPAGHGVVAEAATHLADRIAKFLYAYPMS
jgi:pimeloyl-ACP methyl ester carboxylesterase